MAILKGAPLDQAGSDANPPLSALPSRLLLVRHGESDWNREGRVQGQLDPPLSPRGQAQARELAGRLAGLPLVGFYTSDLRRASETAAAIASNLGVSPVELTELREVGLGAWEGKTQAELQGEYPGIWQTWVRAPSWDLIPGSESVHGFEERVGAIFEKLTALHPEGNILCVTHGGVIQVALGRVCRQSPDGKFPFLIRNASLNVLERGRRGWVIAAVNDTCHLQQS
jgi:broad specificity phosphatase PhoE